jgi:hypothetical protein
MTISATTQGLKPGVCTSSNRPANPFDGMMIYETDTDKVAVYDSSAWVYKTGTAAPINPAMVYLGGTTATTSASINVDSVFSATYQNYLVQVSNFTASVEDFWAMRLRASGSTITASNYSQAGQLNTNTTDSLFIRRTTNTSFWYGDLVTTLSTNPQNIQFWISNPFAAVSTRGNITAAGCTNADYRHFFSAVNYNATTSVDGIALVPYTSGTLSGTIRVYGIVNS